MTSAESSEGEGLMVSVMAAFDPDFSGSAACRLSGGRLLRTNDKIPLAGEVTLGLDNGLDFPAFGGGGQFGRYILALGK